MAIHTRLSKSRLDHLLVAQGLAQSRDVAVRMILAGEVKVDGTVVDKPGKSFPSNTTIEARGHGTRFVSRGGDKLEAALKACSIDPQGMTCLDVGCSTGGFTDCLLQKGAVRVYGVDVGYGQFNWRLRQDPRVVLLERTNIRYIDSSIIPEPVGLAAIDVSFISLTKVLPPLLSLLHPHAIVITLVKPQFEVGKGQVGRGGIVRNDAQRQGALRTIVSFAHQIGLQLKKALDSPVRGKKGNREILAIFEFHPRQL
jgi:23S rRNA (cytidine1920-2'-O)/16S rRNA (cytidine1409-2'-O)-methyltransferase